MPNALNRVWLRAFRRAASALTALALASGGALLCVPGSLIAQDADPYPVAEFEREVEARRGGPPAALASALQELTYGYVYHGRHDEALRVGREALTIFEELGDTTGLAETHNHVGLAHWNEVRYDSAVVNFGRAREHWAALGDPNSLGRVYNNLGATHYQWGNYELALSSFLRALEYRRETGAEAGQALALTNVGRTYHDWGQFDRAREAYLEAVEISDRIDYAFGRAYARLNLGELFLDHEEWGEAETHFRASLEEYGAEAVSIPPTDALGGRVLNSLGLGMARIRQGDTDGGLALLRETLQVARDAENPRYEARALLELGRAYRIVGQFDEAFRALSDGLEAARARDQRPIALELLAALAEVQELRGNPALALSNLQAHVALRDSIFDQGAFQRVSAMEAQAEIERQERENLLLREEQRVQEALIARQRLITILSGGLFLSAVLLAGVLVYFNRRGRRRERALAMTNRSLEDTNRELLEARTEVHALKGLIPICSHCKRIRDDEGYWESVESYITDRSDAHFSHSICTECGPRVYGQDWKDGGDGADDGSVEDEAASPSRR
ncbi:MAG: tetratricopeptide repeat protein [Gemmatimonadales bacterium]|nr:MAG: tetratricopeptide repeat protein [Gemmatimonadales bacterium]